MMNPLGLSCPVRMDTPAFFDELHRLGAEGYDVLSFFGTNDRHLYAVMALSGDIHTLRTDFPSDLAYSSLSRQYPSFQMFEREIYEDYGIVPQGHPWLKPVRHSKTDVADHPFFSSASPLLHEVGVGPVHAGVIEPGHFRFICRGEVVENLEIQLGYQHRGVIKLLEEGDLQAKVQVAECIAGDTAIGHALAYCMVVEALSDAVPAAIPIRAIALELERVAMHLADLSALAGDVAFIMGQNLFAALRTTIINSTLAICGSRFGKRWLSPGGVNYGISDSQRDVLQAALLQAGKQIHDTGMGMLANTSVLSRFDDTGKVSLEAAKALGFTGIAAKCCGVAIDARADFPFISIPGFAPLTETSGDVYGRANLRFMEIEQSLRIVQDLLSELPSSQVLRNELKPLLPDKIAIAVVEGWRGRIVHVAATDSDARTRFYRITDPSLVNWQALEMAVKHEGISDFPLCNKSFDLSYCGSDL